MKICIRCSEEKNLKNFYKNSHMADNRLNMCKLCCKETSNKISQRRAAKKYRDSNKAKVSISYSKWKEKNQQYRNEYMKEWHRINKHLSAAYKAKRKACQRMATPDWSDLYSIKEIYKQSRQLTKLTGIQFHVDHIIPLISPYVQGLHVPANLRIIPYYENVSKGNKLIEDIV